MNVSGKRVRPGLALLLTCGLLAACQTTLLNDLDEQEANEVLACLAGQGITSSKHAEGKGVFSVQVADRDLPRAWQGLRQHGLPRPRHQGFRQVFAKRGLVPGRLEQQALYLSALQEEIAQTLEAAGGVVTARVHITFQQSNRRQRSQPLATAAAVLLEVSNERQKAELSEKQVKEIVSHAVAGLTAEQVSVVKIIASRLDNGVSARSTSPARFDTVKVAIAGTGGLGMLIGITLLVWRRRPGRRYRKVTKL